MTRRRWAILVFLAAVGVYSLTIAHGFAFDDGIAIEKNVYIRSVGSLGKIFTHTEWAGGGLENHLYRPLTTATYAVNYAFTGLSPWSYHLVNVLLHGVVSALVLLLGFRLGLPAEAAGIAALLFAVHPIHVEAVANVVGRKELLAGIFLLALVLAHRRAWQRGGLAMLWPLLAFAAAMLSKEVGVVGIGLVAMLDFLFSGQRPRNSLERRRSAGLYAGYAGLLLLFLLIHRSVAGSLSPDQIPFIDNPAAHAGPWVRRLTAVGVLGKGLRLQFFPLGQSPDYSFNAISLIESPLDPRVLVTVAVLGSWLWLGFGLRQKAPVVLMAAGWYLVTVLPGSNLLFPVGTIFGERLLYVPSIGLALFAGWAVHGMLGKGIRRVQLAAIAGLILLLGTGSMRYASVWGDELQLFTLAATHQPASTKARYKRAEILLKSGRTEEALREGRVAYRISPENHRSGILVAEVLMRKDSLDEAESILGQILRRDPSNADALYGLGRVWRDRGDYGRAEAYWTRAINIDSQHAESLVDLGTLALLRADTAGAIRYLTRGVASDSLKAAGWYNLGLIYERRQDRARARKAFLRFLQVAGPEYGEAVRRIRDRLADG